MFRAFTRPRYQVSVYRTIGPLVLYLQDKYYSIREPSISLGQPPAVKMYESV